MNMVETLLAIICYRKYEQKAYISCFAHRGGRLEGVG